MCEQSNKLLTLSLFWCITLLIYDAEPLFQVGFPLVTLLLCLGDANAFNSNFSQHMEILYKYLKVMFL
jgi:hypothetical protein